MLVSQHIRQFCALMAVGILALPPTFTSAQEIPASKQSVVVFDFKLDRVFEGAQTLGADLKKPMDSIFGGVKLSELKRVYGSANEQLLAMGRVPGVPEFIVRIEFANADACRRMMENMEDHSKEVELEGKTYWTPDDGDVGVYGRRVNDTTFEVGSKTYVLQEERNFLTPSLKELWKTVPDESIRIAADLKTPASFIAEVVAMKSESGYPQVTACLELIDNLETVTVSADLQSDNFLTFVAKAKDTEQAKEVKSGLDPLLKWPKGYCLWVAWELAKDPPVSSEAWKGIVDAIDAIDATQEGSVVRISIPGFAEALQKLLNPDPIPDPIDPMDKYPDAITLKKKKGSTVVVSIIEYGASRIKYTICMTGEVVTRKVSEFDKDSKEKINAWRKSKKKTPVE